MYWPDKKTILTERNIYFNKTQLSVSRLEGEELEFTETKPDNTPVSAHNPPILPPQIAPEIPSEIDEDPSGLEIPTKHIRKLTTKLKEIIEGRAVVSNLLSAPKFTIGTQLPSISDAPGDILEAEEPAD